jgi:succinate dehydrogenase/fumarate reductase cytochrome b subunit
LSDIYLKWIVAYLFCGLFLTTLVFHFMNNVEHDKLELENVEELHSASKTKVLVVTAILMFFLSCIWIVFYPAIIFMKFRKIKSQK